MAEHIEDLQTTLRRASETHGACAELSLTLSPPANKSLTLEAKINAPDFWNDQEKAQRSCSSASSSKSASNAESALDRKASDLETYFHLAQEESNSAQREFDPRRPRQRTRGSGRVHRRPRDENTARGRERPPERHRHNQARRGRHGIAGLGGDASAHVSALGGTKRLSRQRARFDARRRSGHQIRHRADRRRKRLRHARRRKRRASTGAHFAVRPAARRHTSFASVFRDSRN